jgi:hypothetical protein
VQKLSRGLGRAPCSRSAALSKQARLAPVKRSGQWQSRFGEISDAARLDARLRQPFQMHGPPFDNPIVGQPQLYMEIN